MTNVEMNVAKAIELKEQMDALKAELEEAENIIKAEMVNQKLDTMLCMGHVIKYIDVLSSRFDTKRFKEEIGEDAYKEYTKEVASKRFTIS